MPCLAAFAKQTSAMRPAAEHRVCATIACSDQQRVSCGPNVFRVRYCDVSPVPPRRAKMHRSVRDASFCYTEVPDLWRDCRMKVGEDSDDGSGRRRTPFVPSEGWIDAFDSQCTDAMVKRLQRFA